ncbi:coiled-coil-helix-coiled-coil-helix domain-containing protein 7 [Diorhabda carinulata]|uniref:coiled-coil-helix-coiled-coil-helix domain-containing protein 7 n=1 Tax=Diorhabda carinulata TaxID=1163345 RepID=UPI0025A1A237|nr:coiled-coil-helix-coiled-coil-helix domain-containing protein 7 [Diorhabda carinulata]
MFYALIPQKSIFIGYVPFQILYIIMKNTEAEENNPCLKEQELTYKCFHDNSFDKEACQLQIENYKLCKSFWYSVQKERRKQGVRPVMPPLSERDSIKREFFAKFRQQQ